MMRWTLIIILIGWTTNLFAQSDDTSAITIGGYADGYYSWYSNAKDVTLQQHDCIGAYHNNFGLNVAQATVAYDGSRVRGVATLHFGDIPAITWANNYRAIQEANAGVRLAERLWLDVGFFKTHVGTESFLPRDNLMSIISLGTYYGPLYQSGARLSEYTENDWHFEAHAINGYNLHIDNNDYKTFGVLVSKKWSEHVYTSYSNMLGQERVGRQRDGFLVYQNIYTNLVFDKLSIQAGVDVAVSNDWRSGTDWTTDPLIAGLLTAKYSLTERFAVALRGEIFQDPSNINSFQLTPLTAGTGANGQGLTIEPNGINVFGGTVGFEYAPSDIGFLRIESRTLYDPGRGSNDYPIGFSARRAGVNPMLQLRTQVLATVGFYFDKTFKFAR